MDNGLIVLFVLMYFYNITKWLFLAGFIGLWIVIWLACVLADWVDYRNACKDARENLNGIRSDQHVEMDPQGPDSTD
jgi:hypothetical protein